MEIRKSHIIGSIVAAAALIAGVAGADTFDQTVNNAVQKDGSIVSQVAAQKQLAATDPDMIEARGPGGHGGGVHPGNPGRGPGGNPGRGPGHEPGRDPGRGNPGHGDPGHHEGPGHGGGHGPDWHGHQGGWGEHFHGRYGWGWDAWNRPLWLGWAIWSIGDGWTCRAWYNNLHAGCDADCGAELNACLGSGADVGQCNATNVSCRASCDYQYDTVWGPYWRAPGCF